MKFFPVASKKAKSDSEPKNASNWRAEKFLLADAVKEGDMFVRSHFFPRDRNACVVFQLFFLFSFCPMLVSFTEEYCAKPLDERSDPRQSNSSSSMRALSRETRTLVNMIESESLPFPSYGPREMPSTYSRDWNMVLGSVQPCEFGVIR